MANMWAVTKARHRGKAQACNTPEEMLALAKEEGYELSDEELETVSGGYWCPAVGCPTND